RRLRGARRELEGTPRDVSDPYRRSDIRTGDTPAGATQRVTATAGVALPCTSVTPSSATRVPPATSAYSPACERTTIAASLSIACPPPVLFAAAVAPRTPATSVHAAFASPPAIVHAAAPAPASTAVTTRGPSAPIAPAAYGASTTRKPGEGARIV